MNQKGFAPILIILGIVLLLGAVGGAYYFGQSSVKPSTSVSQTPVSNSQTSISPTQSPAKTTISPTPTSVPTVVDETVSWKTYVNTKYGFSFKYPQGFETDTASGNPIDSGKIFRISFLSLDKEDTLSIMTALAEADFSYARKTYGFEGMKNISDSSIQVGSFDTEITLTDSETDKTPVGLDKISSYNVVVKDKLLVIEYGGKVETVSLQKLKQILSTFKFTN